MKKVEIVLKKLIENGEKGVTYLDFIADGISESELASIIQKLEYGIYQTPNDDSIKFNA